MIMMDNMLDVLREHYAINFDRMELMRDGGSVSYTVFSGSERYFLRVIKPSFLDTAVMGADIHVFLQKQGFPVPPVIFTGDGRPYVRTDNGICILYEFVAGGEANPDLDAEAIGALIGRLHAVMQGYTGELVKRDRHFFIDRYIDILRSKHYERTDAFLAYGNALWDKVKLLPRGYCHGDLYVGNIHQTPDGKFYIVDFDTSCDGFPMYDPALICNRTVFFDYDECAYEKSKAVLMRFLSEYMKQKPLSQNEIDAFADLIALYHFALQATIIETYGLDCVDHAFLDRQLDWLYRWREQDVGFLIL